MAGNKKLEQAGSALGMKAQCNTNILFWTEYEYEYIQSLNFDRIQIPNIFDLKF